MDEAVEGLKSIMVDSVFGAAGNSNFFIKNN